MCVGEVPLMRKQTWFGCVTCVGAVVLGYVAAFLPTSVWRLATIVLSGGEPGSFYTIRTPSAYFSLGWVLYLALPCFIRGAVPGSFAALLTQCAYKGPRLDLAAFVAGCVYSGTYVFGAFFSYQLYGVSLDMVLGVVEAAALWVGLLSVAQSVSVPASSPQRFDHIVNRL
jgi:hypothetical protein